MRGKETIRLTNEIVGPRWCGVPAEVRRICLLSNLKLEIKVDTGLISQKTSFAITGPRATVLSVMKAIIKAVEGN